VRTKRTDISGEVLFGSRRFTINLLGMDVMRHTCSYVTLDYPAGKAVFGFAGSYQPEGGRPVWSAPMTSKGGLVTVRVGDGRSTWSAIVDTGSSGCVEISEIDAGRGGNRYAQRSAAVPVFRVGVGIPNSPAATTTRATRIDSLDHLGPRLLRVPTLIVPDNSKIGSGLFRPFRVTLDFRRSVLWLEGAH
jgi:hypothetical protein